MTGSAKRSWRVAALVGVAVLTFAACSSDDSDDAGSDSSGGETTSTTAAAGPSIQVEPGTVTVPAGCTPDAPTCPTVTVTGSGFTAGATIDLVQCVDTGNAPEIAPADCNLGGAQRTTADADGAIPPLSLSISNGPFGVNAVSCAEDNPCVVAAVEDAELATSVEIAVS